MNKAQQVAGTILYAIYWIAATIAMLWILAVIFL